ncbi:tail fiber assembly protein [Atlantibacter hermannii]|uniref:tail fiber assembly protein n=1 Tax=Atlantibacter hermannii TaxID=565 RepID=UPI0035E44DF8
MMTNNYAVVKDGTVINIVAWDGVTEWQPDDGEAVKIDNVAGIGWLYDGKKFTAPEPTQEEIEQQNESKRVNNVSTKSNLMAEATNTVAILQDAVDFEMATDEEVRLLPLWKKYRVLLSRVDADTADDIKWPEQPQK